MRFIDFLVENDQEEFLTDLEKIRDCLEFRLGLVEGRNYKINSDMSVNIIGETGVMIADGGNNMFNITSTGGYQKRLNIKFDDCSKAWFTLDRSGVTSFIGSPRKCKRFSAQFLPSVTSFEGIPEEISLEAIIKGTSISSYSKIHESVKKCQNFYIDPEFMKEALLGFLLIDGMNTLGFTKIPGHLRESPVVRAVEIVNRHLHGSRDVISCKRELVSSGLKEFAKL